MNDPSRSQPTAGIRIRFINLLVLSAFTTAQPIYDLLTRHPEFLPAHQSERVDILLLTLMLSLLLPGAAALVVRSLARVHPQLGTGTYLGLLGLLTAPDSSSRDSSSYRRPRRRRWSFPCSPGRPSCSRIAGSR